MFTIRNDQFKAMEKSYQANDIADTMRTAWPKECETLGDNGLLARIDLGFKNAAAYGIEAIPDVTRFVNLMFLLGEDFDTAEKTKWAGVILKWDSSTELKLFAIEKRAQEQG